MDSDCEPSIRILLKPENDSTWIPMCLDWDKRMNVFDKKPLSRKPVFNSTKEDNEIIKWIVTICYPNLIPNPTNNDISEETKKKKLLKIKKHQQLSIFSNLDDTEKQAYKEAYTNSSHDRLQQLLKKAADINREHYETIIVPIWIAQNFEIVKHLLNDCEAVVEIPIIQSTRQRNSPTVSDIETIQWIIEFAKETKKMDSEIIGPDDRSEVAKRDSDVNLSVFQKMDKLDEEEDTAFKKQHGYPHYIPHARLARFICAAEYLGYPRAIRASARFAVIHYIENNTKGLSPEEGGKIIRETLMPYERPPITT